MRTTRQYGETRCVTCQNGYKNLLKILWTKEFQHTGDAPGSSSRHSASGPLRKVVSDKHSIYTHLPKDPKQRHHKRTKITMSSCRKRIGPVVPGAAKFGDKTADHKVLSGWCDCESRNNHRYSVVVQDSVTHWIESYPCKTKTSEETQKTLRKFLDPIKKPQVHLHWQFLGIW